MTLIIGITIYIAGFLISLILMHKYKDELEINSYDPPHDPYYDDYSSNAQAYAVFSAIWPLFWLAYLVINICRGIVKISENIGKKF